MRLPFESASFEIIISVRTFWGFFPDVVARAFISGTMRNLDRARLLYAVRFVSCFKVLRFRYAI